MKKRSNLKMALVAKLAFLLLAIICVQLFAARVSASDGPPNFASSDETLLPDAPSGNGGSMTRFVTFTPSTVPVVESFVSSSASRNNFPFFYRPLSPSEKLELFLHSSSPMSLGGTLVDAAFAQHSHQWPGYGQGMQGFGKRYGALLADHEVGGFFNNFLLPSAFHQDPRYFRMGENQSVWHRLSYAATRMVVTRTDSGEPSVNTSLLLGTVLSKSLANAYYDPESRGLTRTMNNIGSSLLGVTQTNLTREFLPDMERLCWNHMPHKLRRVEKRMPLARKWEPAAFSDAAPVLR